MAQAIGEQLMSAAQSRLSVAKAQLNKTLANIFYIKFYIYFKQFNLLKLKSNFFLFFKVFY